MIKAVSSNLKILVPNNAFFLYPSSIPLLPSHCFVESQAPTYTLCHSLRAIDSPSNAQTMPNNQASSSNYLLPTLPSTMPPINPQIRPRHEAARITQQKNGRAAVFLRVAQALQHVGIGPSGPALGESLKKTSGHGSHDVTRRQSVDADAVLAPFGGQVAAKLEDGGFGGVVGAYRDVSFQSRMKGSERGKAGNWRKEDEGRNGWSQGR